VEVRFSPQLLLLAVVVVVEMALGLVFQVRLVLLAVAAVTQV
jgi:hypothetical protein